MLTAERERETEREGEKKERERERNKEERKEMKEREKGWSTHRSKRDKRCKAGLRKLDLFRTSVSGRCESNHVGCLPDGSSSGQLGQYTALLFRAMQELNQHLCLETSMFLHCSAKSEDRNPSNLKWSWKIRLQDYPRELLSMLLWQDMLQIALSSIASTAFDLWYRGS